ncbi:MAG: mechanosensitive ion channel [Magnetococcales bacterium]|nr:mechanosensitive ion channel [Magnetococcales bacterium]MBF0148962.1 mechanosensitive ion channel [Magnetococcales bacterium]MBF0173818.1 mechanosensitive ion channel [Magnetococcales bacterium]MBF0347843.1 mechanosensitive ion channel [Magnetococcales bacterium]MBF0631167.1 mechanosensitive ion channel [Magnetococcales bacterium]
MNALCMIRLVNVLLWDGVVAGVSGTKAPRLIKQLSSVVIFFITVVGIVGVVLEKDVTALWATSGAVGLVIGFAVQGIILDTVSGLAIHFENTFSVGDWVLLHTRAGKFFGQVKEVNWRATRILTLDNTLVLVPNRTVTSIILTNLSMTPVQVYELKFVFDFSVPVDRALRVLTSGVLNAIGPEGILETPRPEVLLGGINDLGVEYCMRYAIQPAKIPPPTAQHLVLVHVLRHIDKSGLTLAYPKRDVFTTQMPWRQKNWESRNKVELLGKCDLFSQLPPEALEFIASQMQLIQYRVLDHVFRQGDSGDSMFILAEGLLDVFVTREEPSHRVRIAQISPGGVFGEMSVLTGEERTATVTAAHNSLVGEIGKECIKDLLNQHHEFASTISRFIAERMFQTQQTLSTPREEREKIMASTSHSMLGKMKQFLGFDE